MRFFVSYSHSCLKQKALSLSKNLNLELFDHFKIDDIASFSNDYFLVCTSERLILKKGLKKNLKPIFSNFDDWGAESAFKALSNDQNHKNPKSKASVAKVIA